MLSRQGRLSLLLSFALLCVACGPRVAAGADRPHVLLILVDALRLDQVGCYGTGSDATPAIDALGAEGVIYANATSQAPWSMPSIAALLSSRHPTDLGLDAVPARLPRDVDWLPATLSEAGWRTAAVVSHPFLSADIGFDRGFESFTRFEGGDESPQVDRVTSAALEYAGESSRRPFFLLVEYADPRPPWHVPADEGYAGPLGPGLALGDMLRLRAEFGAADRAEIRRQYAESVAATDRGVGALLAGLRERGLYENTLIVLAGTNGIELLDHGDLGDGKTLYDELIRVPLIVRYPGEGRGTIDVPVALIDVYPTILHSVDLDPDDGLDGISIRPGAARVERAIFAETSRARRLRAVMHGGWKLVEDLESGTRQIFDRGVDPNERTDLGDDGVAPAARLEQLLEGF